MHKMIKIVFLGLGLVAALGSVPLFAEEHVFEWWTGVYSQGPSDSKHQLFFEVQPRFGSNVQRLSQILVRPAYVYNLSENAAVFLGYGWTPQFLSGRAQDEQRPWQQFLYHDTWGAHPWSLRFRLEERFIAALPVALRLRLMGRISHPFWGTPLSAVVWDELFINLNSVDTGPQGGFDRNRLFLGLGWGFHSLMSLEFGYLNQLVNRSPVALMDHVLVSYLFIRY